jgi:hypothetical protein
MRKSSNLSLLTVVPLAHRLIAIAIAVGITTACLVRARHLPQEYTSSAVLLFDPSTASAGSGNTAKPAEALAKSILSDDVLKTVGRQMNLIPPNASSGAAKQLRGHLILSEFAPRKLRVGWQDINPGQTSAMANAVADLLASWVPVEGAASPRTVSPAPEIAPAVKPVARNANPSYHAAAQDSAGPLQARQEMLLRVDSQLKLQIESTDHRLTALSGAERELGQTLQQVNAGRQKEIAARQPSEALVAAARKKLDDLRTRYTDAYPDVEAAQEHLAEAQKQLASLPPVRPADVGDQARLDALEGEAKTLRVERGQLLSQLQNHAKLEKGLRSQRWETERPESASAPDSSPPALPAALAPVAASTASASSFWTSPFNVLEHAGEAQSTDGRRTLLRWLGTAAGILCGLLYFTLAIRWFRPVNTVTELNHVVPGEVTYLGAIPGIHR